MVECVSPARPEDLAETSVEVKISMNGVDFSANEFGDNSMQFGYQHQAEVLSVSPSFGSVSGNTEITVSGSNFEFGEELSCR